MWTVHSHTLCEAKDYTVRGAVLKLNVLDKTFAIFKMKKVDCKELQNYATKHLKNKSHKSITT